MVDTGETFGGRFLTVRVCEGCRAALPLENVSEITRPLPLEPVAGAPPFVTGVAVVRASAVPVVDLAAVLGLQRASDPARYVVLHVGDHRVAVAVESVIGITALADEPRHMPPLLSGAPAEIVDAIGALDAELLLTLKVSRLVEAGLCEAVVSRKAGA